MIRRRIAIGIMVGSLSACILHSNATMSHVKVKCLPNESQSLPKTTVIETVENVSKAQGESNISNQEDLAYLHIEGGVSPPHIIEESEISTYEETDVEYYNYISENCLTQSAGVNYNSWGNMETYYNLEMSGVVAIMRDCGFTESEYPYWVRQDGVKMLGDYVIVAANLYVYPRGTVVNTSLGVGLVCDTGGFADSNETQFDIATDW